MLMIVHCPSCKARMRIHVKQGPHVDDSTRKVVISRRYYCRSDDIWVTTDVPVVEDATAA